MIILTIIAFIIIFSILVLVHEWGHFIMARRAGIKVEEFGVGLPPRAKSIYKDKKGTIYSLNWVPFGGYVRLYGEDSTDPKVLKSKKSYASKTIWQRASVIVAGVVMNIFLAWVLITIGFTIGMKPFLATQDDLDKAIAAGLVETKQIIYVHEISPNLPLSETDLKQGDFIININDNEVPDADQFGDIIQPDHVYHLTVMRNNKEHEIEVLSDENGKLGFTISTEQLLVDVENVRYPFYYAPFYAIQEIGRLSVLTVKMFGNVIVTIVSKLTVPEGVAGPVGIARLTHHFTQQGIMALVQFTALISISLGVINIMPFPALDGGRLMFIIFELITRRRPSAKWESVIHTIGFALLMALILVVTWNDIMNIFR